MVISSIRAGAAKLRKVKNRIPSRALRALSCFKWVPLLGMTMAVAPNAFGGDVGSEVFTKACGPCHGKDGRAQTPAAKKLGVKNLSESKLTDAQIVKQILEGKLDQKKDSKMPGFKEKLTKAEIDSLVPVVKAFRK